MREGGREGGGESRTGKLFYTSTCPRVTVTGDLLWHKADTALESDASNQTLADQVVGEGLLVRSLSIRAGGTATP